MSNTIRLYAGDRNIGKDSGYGLVVGAYVGKYGRSVQLTIDGPTDHAYVGLSEKQVMDLIGTLSMRLLGKPGYDATGPAGENAHEVVNPEEVE